MHSKVGLVAAAMALTAAIQGPSAAREIFTSTAGDLAVETIAPELERPWSLAFLPDGRMLVTERPGRLRVATRTGALSPPLDGVPQVLTVNKGQAGLFDLAIDRDRRQTIYFCYAEPVDGGGRTAVARARLIDEGTPRIDRVTTIFRAQGPAGRRDNFGCRIVQALDGNLFVSIGDYFDHRQQAQNLDTHLGKIVRVRPDGTVPGDNPLVGRAAARPEIWSYGHRNPQGFALHPATGKLWAHEHGPLGGDELNVIEPGRNYGWPAIGFGKSYDGKPIHEGTRKAGMEQPVKHWTPAIAPSGMTFYTGNLVPSWRGDLFIGALAGKLLLRVELDGDKVINEERLLVNLRERIRDVRQGPDGALWLLTDNVQGRILRIAPAK